MSTPGPRWVPLGTTHSCLCGRYDPGHVCNASRHRRGATRGKNGPKVCRWNLQKLAEALDPRCLSRLAEAILAQEFDAGIRPALPAEDAPEAGPRADGAGGGWAPWWPSSWRPCT